MYSCRRQLLCLGLFFTTVTTSLAQSSHISNSRSFEITVAPPTPTLVVRAKPGDLVFSIPPSVVAAANQALVIDPGNSPGCNDGLGDFDVKAVKAATVAKRALQYADAICSSENLIENVIRGGPLAVLQQINIGDFAIRAAGAADAYAVVLEYARSVSGHLSINYAELATLAWIMAFEYHEKHYVIKEVNTIPAADIERASATQSSGKQCTSTASLCTAHCQAIGGAMRACTTECKSSTTTGACRAGTATDDDAKVVTPPYTPWTVYPPTNTGIPTPAPSAECSNDNSGLPGSDFLKGVQGDFCERADGNPKGLTKSYDGTGDDFAQTPGPFGSPNDINPTLFKIDLTFTPLPGAKCSMSCVDAYKFLVNSNCGKNGGDKMSLSGHLNVGCGIYFYSILPPPQLSPQTCYNTSSHGDTRKADLNFIIPNIIKIGWGPKLISPSDKELSWQSSSIKGTVYKFSVGWVLNCISTVQPMNVGQPIPGISIQDLLYGDWSQCNNGGAGGQIDAGCLRYSFSPGTNDRDLRRK
ncbi:hypothetical protein TWF694_003033 [Orbilia ellipsospora]|uniref:Uncharacterized protein n=1 Tax=Orbilia ellipsospora TaxID=2528407 RepID=A0AAV9X0F7_9PEZI